MELWLPIKDFSGYEVSSDGRVRNSRTGQVLTPGFNTNGYYIVCLWRNGKQHTKTVHRLVASTFYDMVDDRLVVDHVDGNKTNNHISNLEFCSSGENNRRAYALGLKKAVRQYDHPRNKKIRVVETGEVFRSISECARAIGGSRRHIGDCLHGRILTHHGYHYEFVD